VRGGPLAIDNAGDCGRWFVVDTKTGRENVAAEHLKWQSYKVFAPWTRKTVRHARTISTVRADFFPGYILVDVGIHRQRWRPIDGTPGFCASPTRVARHCQHHQAWLRR
jgi:transcription antitermination factor NusG